MSDTANSRQPSAVERYERWRDLSGGGSEASYLNHLQMGIVGALAIDPSLAGEVSALVPIAAFTDKLPKALYCAICELHFEGVAIDPITILNRAGSGYREPLMEAMNLSPIVDRKTVMTHCGILLEMTRLLAIRGYGSALSYAPSLDEANVLIDELNALTGVKEKIEILSLGDALVDFYARMNEKKEPEYIGFGMKGLDENTFVELGDYIILGGYTSAGKTLLSLQFAMHMAKKYRVGFFSLETNTKKLTDRAVTFLAQVPLRNIKKNSLSSDEWTRVAAAAEANSQYSFDFIHNGSLTVRDIQAVALNKRYQIIFVDYLQLLSSDGKSRYEEVTNISKSLHVLAQTHGITVVALSQLSRAEKTKGGKYIPPSLSSFRESGQIEQDADIAFLLYSLNPDDSRSNRMLKMAKQKDGDRDNVELKFDGATQTMTPVPPTFQSQMAEVNKAIREETKKRQMQFDDYEDDEIPF